MKVIKKEIENEGRVLDTVELVKGNEHLVLSMSEYGELSASLFYDDKDGLWYQEPFNIDKNDGEVYKAVDGVFLSYGGDVFFDTYGANVVLNNNEGSYSFLFMKEFYEATNEIKCDFIDQSMENSSMKTFYDRLSNIALEETKVEEPVIKKSENLSKTLRKILEK